MNNANIEKQNTNYLYNWEDNTENFFYWVVEVCGYEKESEEYQALKSMIKTKVDLDKFLQLFDGNLNLTSTIDRMTAA